MDHFGVGELVGDHSREVQFDVNRRLNVVDDKEEEGEVAVEDLTVDGVGVGLHHRVLVGPEFVRRRRPLCLKREIQASLVRSVHLSERIVIHHGRGRLYDQGLVARLQSMVVICCKYCWKIVVVENAGLVLVLVVLFVKLKLVFSFLLLLERLVLYLLRCVCLL